jgi:hypothetical protein
MEHSCEPTLPIDHAFVVQFDAETAAAEGHLAGRVEHIRSAQATHFQSWEELLAFITRVLRA